MKASTAVLVLLATLGGCRSGYAPPRPSDPVARAGHDCRYLLERGLVDPSQRDPDGVLRHRVAAFSAPTITRNGDVLRFAWPAGGISVIADGSTHHGACEMTLRPSGHRVDSVTLDGRSLNAGFGM